MSHRTRALCRALLFGSGVAALGSAQAQEQTAPEVAKVEEVVVTGSLIKRTDFQTPSPVQVISAQDMVQSGYTSVSQVLSNLAANGQGALSQSFNGAFAGGASGIALRGLTLGSTLTLIDGERMVPYPLTDDGQRSFVDISSIPMVAVDRIDVLKDGASAIYGSDAMAGVINVVLKKTYTGAELDAEGGATQHGDGATWRLSGIGGFGDLGSDGYNGYLAAEFRRQDAIYVGSRSGLWTNQNWSAFGGGSTQPGSGANGVGAVPFPSIPGGYLLPPGTGGAPTSATSYQDPAVTFLPGSNCSAALLAADKCTYSDPHEEIQPPTENLNLIGRFTVNLGHDWQSVTTVSMFRSLSEQVGGYDATDPGMQGLNVIAQGPGIPPTPVPAIPLILTVPASYPGNPYGVAAPVVDTLTELGQAETQYTTQTYRLFEDISGTLGGWNVDVDLGEMYAKTVERYYGALNIQALQTALNNGYVLGSNGAQLTSLAAPPFDSTASNSLQVVDLRGTRELFQLPGGPLSFGLGAGYNHRYLDATQATPGETGLQAINTAYAVGGQNNLYAYGEIVAPILHNLEVDLDGRYDHYSGVGGDATPKFGVKYSPIGQITLRGTYSEGFRAPNPAEAGVAGESFFAVTAPDPGLCPGVANGPSGTPPQPGDFPSQCAVDTPFIQTTNSHLKPETSKSFTVGAVFSPIKNMDLSVDYWQVKVANQIFSAFELPFGLSNDYLTLVRNPPTVLPQLQPNGSLVNEPTVCANGSGGFTPCGTELYTAVPYENASTKVNGLDVDFNARFDLGALGRLSARLNYTHTFVYQFGAVDPTTGETLTAEIAGSHGPVGISGDTGNPKDRGVFSLSWDKGGLDITGTLNYTGRMSILDPSSGINDCATALEEAAASTRFGFTGVSPAVANEFCHVASFIDVDLYAQYRFPSNITVHGSITNVFNRAPPVDLQTYGAPFNLAYNPALAQEGAVGRLFMVGATYKF